MGHKNYITLWEHLASIPDPRSLRGRRYEWTFVLTLLAAAMLAGQESLLAMSQWITAHEEIFVEALKPSRKRVPSYGTLRRGLLQVPIEQLETQLRQYTQALDEDDGVSGRIETQDGRKLRGQSVDGKSVRGASAHGDKVHLVSVVRHESAAVLAQIETQAGIDEPKAAKTLLHDFSLVDTVTTMDALYTERPLARQIVAAGGHYLMVVKRNQRTLYEEIDLAFSVLPPTSSWEREFWHYDQTLTHESGHGRTEIRRLERTTALNDYLDWPGVGQVLRRTYRRIERSTGRISEEVHYGSYSSLSERRDELISARMMVIYLHEQKAEVQTCGLRGNGKDPDHVGRSVAGRPSGAFHCQHHRAVGFERDLCQVRRTGRDALCA